MERPPHHYHADDQEPVYHDQPAPDVYGAEIEEGSYDDQPSYRIAPPAERPHYPSEGRPAYGRRGTVTKTEISNMEFEDAMPGGHSFGAAPPTQHWRFGRSRKNLIILGFFALCVLAFAVILMVPDHFMGREQLPELPSEVSGSDELDLENRDWGIYERERRAIEGLEPDSASETTVEEYLREAGVSSEALAEAKAARDKALEESEALSEEDFEQVTESEGTVSSDIVLDDATIDDLDPLPAETDPSAPGSAVDTGVLEGDSGSSVNSPSLSPSTMITAPSSPSPGDGAGEDVTILPAQPATP